MSFGLFILGLTAAKRENAVYADIIKMVELSESKTELWLYKSAFFGLIRNKIGTVMLQ